MFLRARLGAVLVVALGGCGGDDEVRTVTVDGGDRQERITRFALAETREQARKTCAVVPRDVLARSFARVSDDRPSVEGRRLTANDIALLYVEDIGINPIPLQRAAYDGCMAGQRLARGRR